MLNAVSSSRRSCVTKYTKIRQAPKLIREAAIKRRENGAVLASFPGLPCFYLPFVFTIIHGSGRPFPCIIVNVNGRSKWERLGTEAVKPLCSD